MGMTRPDRGAVTPSAPAAGGSAWGCSSAAGGSAEAAGSAAAVLSPRSAADSFRLPTRMVRTKGTATATSMAMRKFSQNWGLMDRIPGRPPTPME